MVSLIVFLRCFFILHAIPFPFIINANALQERNDGKPSLITLCIGCSLLMNTLWWLVTLVKKVCSSPHFLCSTEVDVPTYQLASYRGKQSFRGCELRGSLPVINPYNGLTTRFRPATFHPSFGFGERVSPTLKLQW